MGVSARLPSVGIAASAALASWLASTAPAPAQPQSPEDLVARLGARESVLQASLSPDGGKIAWIAPFSGQGTAVFVVAIGTGERARPILTSDGAPDAVRRCDWLSETRLVCVIQGALETAGEVLPYSRIIALDADGTNRQILSRKQPSRARRYHLDGGDVIDWLADEGDAVLVTSNRLLADQVRGRLGVDRIDTRTLAVTQVEPARPGALGYLSDGRGVVRVMAMVEQSSEGYYDGDVRYLYRRKDSREWEPLREGFAPVAIDPELDVAYGWKALEGRDALYKVKLDGSGSEELVFAHPEVDVDAVVRIGPSMRVVGVSYVTDIRQFRYFDADINQALVDLARTMPTGKMLQVVDSSHDERRLLVWAGDDIDPGSYYLYDRRAGRASRLLPSRPGLGGIALARMQPMTYPAADGTLVPGYLTLPPGKESATGLPALVLPHGGPSARDEWGFDWLSQYFALRGYVVLQPNFRGSAGYGDAWLQENGFKSWRIAIGDVIDAGRWLLREGADPARLAILGWSYGGYAALQSAVVDPDLFKAVVAIAPVTDLKSFAEERRNFTSHRWMRDFIGTGPHLEEGSPARNADRIRAPVLLFHGDLDRNVRSRQSRLMQKNLKKAGRSVQLITWEGLDHHLQDAEARKRLLAESDRFMAEAFGASR